MQCPPRHVGPQILPSPPTAKPLQQETESQDKSMDKKLLHRLIKINAFMIRVALTMLVITSICWLLTISPVIMDFFIKISIIPFFVLYIAIKTWVFLGGIIRNALEGI